MSIRVRLQSPHTVPADYDFEGPEIVIGRAAGAAVVIPDTRVSRQHARIVRRDGDWWVEDLGTRNGTLLNGELMAGAAKLKAGTAWASATRSSGSSGTRPTARRPRRRTRRRSPSIRCEPR
jgi:hypothetical protein